MEIKETIILSKEMMRYSKQTGKCKMSKPYHSDSYSSLTRLPIESTISKKYKDDQVHNKIKRLERTFRVLSKKKGPHSRANKQIVKFGAKAWGEVLGFKCDGLLHMLLWGNFSASPGYECEEGSAEDPCDVDEDSYLAGLVVAEGESVYDFCWYPGMSASDPVSCVFASTTRDHPNHIWDAWTGQLRCTYRAYDAMDEITAAFSNAFNPAGSKIFAGYNKSMRIFDVHRPGREFEQYSTLKGKNEGQAGIILAIAFSPAHTGLLATGSYSQTTAIYTEDNMELLYVLHGQQGGVTHDPYIMCWDVRKAVEVVYKLYRSSEDTNQRIYFDIDPGSQHLATGGQDGLVHVYDVQTGQWVSGFQAASDTVNGFSFHPFLPMATSSSGQRRFDVPDDDEVELHLPGDQNCLSVWSFSCHPTADNQTTIDNGPNSS
ncbi:hypothetical protein MLD38_036960 [Melastoma candidum]|uniref:Uncharacterized protein n=1 Tax=Melastoma candidum TaxID=119954 RepID=A0ACB9LLZ7_9MYRT|nr:hypothetical protein MLD38_036960 [Melastoma candidum]